MDGALLALDLATRTGFALWTPGETGVHSGTFVLPKTGNDVGHYLVKFDEWLTPFLEVGSVKAVAFEAPWVGPQTSQDTARKLLCLAGMVEYLCQRGAVPRVYECNNMTVRKHFLGQARGKRDELKRAAIAACRQRGWDPANDDEADALAVLDYAAHVMKLDPPWASGGLFKAGAAA